MINLNGTLVKKEEANLAYDNRGLNYGDAVFETLRISEDRIFFWEDHYFRLMASMRILRMEIPMNFTMEFLEAEILKVIHSNGQEGTSFRAKLLVWRKAGGKYTPITNDVDYLISAEALSTNFYSLENDKYEVELYKDHYVSSGLMSTLKSNNRLINILGGVYAEENDYQNCLLLNQNKQVIEALNGNIFLVSGTNVKTPPLTDGCINGILRKQIISILNKMKDFNVDEASISPFELQKADELFITNIIQGIVSITKYRKKDFGSQLASILIPKLNLKVSMG